MRFNYRAGFRRLSVVTGLVGAGSVGGIDMALKRSIAAGRIVGPRITACSRDLMVSAPPQRRNPEVGLRVVRVLGERIGILEERLAELAYGGLRPAWRAPSCGWRRAKG